MEKIPNDELWAEIVPVLPPQKPREESGRRPAYPGRHPAVLKTASR